MIYFIYTLHRTRTQFFA